MLRSRRLRMPSLRSMLSTALSWMAGPSVWTLPSPVTTTAAVVASVVASVVAVEAVVEAAVAASVAVVVVAATLAVVVVAAAVAVVGLAGTVVVVVASRARRSLSKVTLHAAHEGIIPRALYSHIRGIVGCRLLNSCAPSMELWALRDSFCKEATIHLRA